MTIYSLMSVLWWNLVGQWMYYVYSRGWTVYWTHRLLPRFSDTVPQWWLDSWWNAAWWYNNLDDGLPNTAFVLFYRRAARDRYQDWIDNAADNVARPLFDYLGSLLGSLLHAYTTFSNWIEVIYDRVGTAMPEWTTNALAGLTKLYNWLPSGLFAEGASWDTLWDAIKIAVKDWAKLRYDAARTWVANNAAWLVASFNTVRTWYDAVSTWITNFKANPYGTVAGWLGDAWATLVTFSVDAATFFYNLWGSYAEEIGAFWDDPLMWLYDRVEDELIRRW